MTDTFLGQFFYTYIMEIQQTTNLDSRKCSGLYCLRPVLEKNCHALSSVHPKPSRWSARGPTESLNQRTAHSTPSLLIAPLLGILDAPPPLGRIGTPLVGFRSGDHLNIRRTSLFAVEQPFALPVWFTVHKVVRREFGAAKVFARRKRSQHLAIGRDGHLGSVVFQSDV